MNKWAPVVAMICIVVLEVVALIQGIDGAAFGVVIAAVAGLGGYQVKALKDKAKGGE